MLFQVNQFGSLPAIGKSQEMTAQIPAVRERMSAIMAAANKHGVDPAVIAAVMSRETNVETSPAYRSLRQYNISSEEQLNRIRATLDRNVRAGQITEAQRQAFLELRASDVPGLHIDERCWGDGGAQGFGPMQLDYRYNAHIIMRILLLRTREERLIAALDEGANILKANVRLAQRFHPNASLAQHWQAAIAAYNCGFGNIKDINNIDGGTTGKDYSADVVGRMRILVQAGVFAGSVGAGGTSTPPPTNNQGTNNPPPTNTNTGSGSAAGTYTVVAGDTGSRIAQKTGHSIAAITAANPGLDWTRLQIGQVLRLPRANTGTSTPPPTNTNASSGSAGGSYTVVAGDTGSRIAQKTGHSIAAITAANPGLDWTRLQIGQVLRLPGGGGTSTPPPSNQGSASSTDIRHLETVRSQVEALRGPVTNIVRAFPIQGNQRIMLNAAQTQTIQNYMTQAEQLRLGFQGATAGQRQTFEARYPGYLKLIADQVEWLRTNYIPRLSTGAVPTSQPQIIGTVGRNGQNRREDVRLVQELLRDRWRYSITADGLIGPRTITAIEDFQRNHMGVAHPSGRIVPNESEWFGLLGIR